MTDAASTAKPTFRPLEVREINIAVAMRDEMVREMNPGNPDEKYPGWRERYLAFFTDRVASGTAALFIAESDGNPIGIAAIYLPETHRTVIFKNKAGYVTNVYVNKRWRKRGIASELTRLTIDWAKREGCEVVRLRTSPMGRSVYAGVGFAPSEEMEIRL